MNVNEQNKLPKYQETRLIPLSKWPHYHVWPTISGLRNLIIRQQNNGFSLVTRRVGKKILIDEAAFFIWVNRQSEPLAK